MKYEIKTLGTVARYVNGRAFKPSEWEKTGLPIIRIQNLTDNKASFNFSSKVHEDKYRVKNGDLLFAWSASLGAHIWRGSDAWLNQHIFRIEPNDEIEKLYLYYFLCCVVSDLYSKTHGSGMVHITKGPFMATPIPVPTRESQKRIVARIEELFSELDKAVETLNTTKKQVAVYRQAVLKSAFEGRYTLSWRKMHSDISPRSDFNSIRINAPDFKDTSGDENSMKLNIPASWLKIRFGEVFEVEVGATPSRRIPAYWNGSISWVSSGEVHFNTINFTRECITEEGLKHASTNLHPIGTVMLAMIGEGKTRGQAAILNTPSAHNQNTAAILVSKTPCHPKYVYYFLQMNYENTRRVGSGNNQKALNKERVRALLFPFSSFEEQKNIVEEIESRLSICEQVQKMIDQSLQKAEVLRQSILKQAFERK